MNKPIEISVLKKNNPKLRFFFSRIISIWSFTLILIILLTGFLSIYTPQSLLFYIFFWVVLIFYVWWLIRWFEYIFLLITAYIRYKNYQKLTIKNIFDKKPITKIENILYKKYKQSWWQQENLYHWVIIPTFQDPYVMLKDTFESIKNSNTDNKKIIITLAWEEKDKDNFDEIENKILSDYKDVFFYVNTTLHPYWVEWELPWKGSNVTFSAKNTYKNILHFWLKEENIIVSVMDSESIVQDKYFEILSFEYCITKDDMKDKTIYQPMLFLFNRFFQAPFFAKVIALSTSFYILAASIKWIWTRAQAVQAQSLSSLIQTEFYSTETITEDWHQYYRTYCTFDWKFQVRPVYTYVLLEPVIWKNLSESIKLQYNQIKRWAHWALDLPYIIICFIKNKKLPKFRTLYEIFWLLESSVLWWSLQFILFFWSIFFYFISWFYTSIFKNFAILWLLVLLILIIIITIFLPWDTLWSKKKILYEWFKYVLFSFTIMWPMLLILNWLPALHAQLLILIWKPMGKFNVTKKYR